MAKTDRGGLTLESVLIVSLLVLTAAFTLITLGQEIACAYAKETAAFGGEVPAEMMETCGFADAPTERLQVLDISLEYAAYEPMGITRTMDYRPLYVGPYDLVDSEGQVVATASFEVLSDVEQFANFTGYTMGVGYIYENWESLPVEYQQYYLDTTQILDFGEVPHGDYTLLRPDDPTWPGVVVSVYEGSSTLGLYATVCAPDTGIYGLYSVEEYDAFTGGFMPWEAHNTESAFWTEY